MLSPTHSQHFAFTSLTQNINQWNGKQQYESFIFTFFFASTSTCGDFFYSKNKMKDERKHWVVNGSRMTVYVCATLKRASEPERERERNCKNHCAFIIPHSHIHIIHTYVYEHMYRWLWVCALCLTIHIDRPIDTFSYSLTLPDL